MVKHFARNEALLKICLVLKIRTTYRTGFESGPKSIPCTVLKKSVPKIRTKSRTVKYLTKNPFHLTKSVRIFDTVQSFIIMDIEFIRGLNFDLRDP